MVIFGVDGGSDTATDPYSLSPSSCGSLRTADDRWEMFTCVREMLEFVHEILEFVHEILTFVHEMLTFVHVYAQILPLRNLIRTPRG